MNMKHLISLVLILIFKLKILFAQCDYEAFSARPIETKQISMCVVNGGFLGNLKFPKELSGYGLLPYGSFIVGTKIDDTIYVSSSEQGHDFAPGIILPNGNRDTSNSELYRVYSVITNPSKIPAGPERDKYERDYLEWPVSLGAPVQNNGRPLIWGNQTVWTISTDADSFVYGVLNYKPRKESPPMRAELRTTSWIHDSTKFLEYVVFVKFYITNKNNRIWKNTYVGIKLSPGLYTSPTQPSPTFAGSDSILKLGFLYGSTNFSSPHYGHKIPAVGYLPLSGSIPFYSINRFIWGGTVPNFPSSDYKPSNKIQEYRALQGFDRNGNQIINPLTQRPTLFPYSGDPIAKTGWLDKNVNEHILRILYINFGPFDLAPGESQEVVGAIIVGQGRDHLQSVNVLKHHARYVKSAYPFLFGAGLPSATVNASSLGGKVFLTWDNNAEQELPPLSTYKFQGYYIYQGETANGPWHKIATFDKSDDVTLMMDEVYSQQHLTLTDIVVDELPNKGLRQFLAVDRDTINRSAFINGRPYHFAVEPFWYDTESRPKFKAGKKVAATVVPQQQVPGSVYDEPFAVVPHSRKYDDAVQIHIIDPTKLKAKDYSVNVTLSLPDSAIRWTLKEEPNTVLLTEQTDTSGLFANPVIDGFTVTVKKPPVGLRRDFQSPQGWQYLPEENRFMTGALQYLIMDGFSSGIVYPTKQNYESRGTTVRHDFLKQVMIRFGQTQKAYRYATKVRAFPFSDPPRDSSFIPFIKNRGGGFVYQDFVDVPFTVWEIDTLDGDPSPRQLNAAFTESNDSLYSSTGTYLGRGLLNGRWKPTITSNGGDERIYIFASDYSETPNAFYTQKNLLLNGDSIDTYYVIAARADTSLRKDKKDSFTDGDVFILTPNYPLVNNRTFTFSTSAPTIANAQLAKQQGAMELISVFPNPYMGGHALESSVSSRFVTISGLPATSIIRIFNLSGRLIRTIYHNTVTTSLQQWDLRNDEGIKVASGLYLIHIESPGIGTKVLKLMVLYPDERLNAY
jgi:hypothetical protein